MKMETVLLVLLGVVVLAFIAKGFGQGLKGSSKKGSFGPRSIATANEQKMFWRLVSTFAAPEFVVLTQVSFGALLTAKGGASRYSFAQKRADFVLTNKGFKVLAVIELDDSSHKGREGNDAGRDAMLIEAGYKVLRYTGIPEAEKLKADVFPPPPKTESKIEPKL